MQDIVFLVCAAACLVLPGCGRSDALGGAASTSSRCGHAAGVDSTAPGACETGDALLACKLASGAGCDCVTDDASCDGCGPGTGATCLNACTDNEYAVACGGPPRSDLLFTYADPPAGCRTVFDVPSGATMSCCPCQ